MYTQFQVILVAEDGEYILSEWQDYEQAIKEVEKIMPNYGEGQRLEVREHTENFCTKYC